MADVSFVHEMDRVEPEPMWLFGAKLAGVLVACEKLEALQALG